MEFVDWLFNEGFLAGVKGVTKKKNVGIYCSWAELIAYPREIVQLRCCPLILEYLFFFILLIDGGHT